MNPSWIPLSALAGKRGFLLAAKSITWAINFGGTSLCRGARPGLVKQREWPC